MPTLTLQSQPRGRRNRCHPGALQGESPERPVQRHVREQLPNYRPGAGNNFLFHENQKITINANGDVTVIHDNFSADCK